MCGIIGSVNVEWSKSPLNSIKHRGPDFHSEFVIIIYIWDILD